MSVEKIGASSIVAKPQEMQKIEPQSKQELQVEEITPEAKEKIKTSKDNLIANYAPEIVGTGIGAGGSAFAIHKVNSVVKPLRTTLENTKETAIEFANLSDAIKDVIINPDETTKEITGLFQNKKFLGSVAEKLGGKFPEFKADFLAATKENVELEQFISKAKETILGNYPNMADNITEIFDEVTLEAVKEELGNPELISKLQRVGANALVSAKGSASVALGNVISEAMKLYPNIINTTEMIMGNIEIIQAEITNPETKEAVAEIIKRYTPNIQDAKKSISEINWEKMLGEIRTLDLPDYVQEEIDTLEKNVPKITELFKNTKTAGQETLEAMENLRYCAQELDPEVMARIKHIISENLPKPNANEVANKFKLAINEISEVMSPEVEEILKRLEERIDANEIAKELADKNKKTQIIDTLIKELDNIKNATTTSVKNDIKEELPQSAEAIKKLIKMLSSEEFINEYTDGEKARRVLSELLEALPKGIGEETKKVGGKVAKETLNAVEEELKTAAPKTSNLIEATKKWSLKTAQILTETSGNSEKAGGKLIGKIKEQFKNADYSCTKFTENTFDTITKNINKYQKIAIATCMLLIPTGYAFGNITNKLLSTGKNKKEADVKSIQA